MLMKKYILFLLLAGAVVSLPAQPAVQAGKRSAAIVPANGTGTLQNTAATVLGAETVPLPVKRFLSLPCMKGATFGLSVKELRTGKEIYAYNPGVQVTPASVMKTVTTATALEVLGKEYTFPTVLKYDGKIENDVLDGNLYIGGSGDPTLGSRHLNDTPSCGFLQPWLKALRKAGIKKIKGAVVADESCFDQQGLSWKWVNEDLGSYYGAGSYGITAFDNNYTIRLQTGDSGTVPVIKQVEPRVRLTFHNRLRCVSGQAAEYYISGAPFSNERYLFGTVPCQRESYPLKGDIPDPALFLAQYVTGFLREHGIAVGNEPSCYRLLQERGTWNPVERTELVTTFSPSLDTIVRITNEVSQNLYADILLKTVGNRYVPVLVDKPEAASSFEKGTEAVKAYWERQGLDISSLWMYDGSGLAVTDKLSAGFLTDLLIYMRTRSANGGAFYTSLPLAGQEGSVRNFLKGTRLQGNARLKSGSMSRVRSYAGYIESGGKEYAVALIVNQYGCEGKEITREIERLLTALF